MANRTVVYIDADEREADWPKTSWDLPIDLGYWEAQPLLFLADLVDLPAFKAAPDDVAALIRRRLGI